jgi:hypothetical protein
MINNSNDENFLIFNPDTFGMKIILMKLIK